MRGKALISQELSRSNTVGLTPHWCKQDSDAVWMRVLLVAFFHSIPVLAFLYRLVLALHVVFVEVGRPNLHLSSDACLEKQDEV
jgi:hypothetical protein